MEEKVFKQMKRYVELSSKFSKTSEQVFGKESNLNFVGAGSSLTIDGSYYGGTLQTSFNIDGRELYVDDSGVVKAKDKAPVTRAEKIRAKAEQDAIVADEYDEYLSLRIKLQTYFSSLEKLTE
jgi:hypothetical protein